MAPVSRPPMDQSDNRNNEQGDLPSPVPFNEFSQNDASNGISSNPLAIYQPFVTEYAVTAELNLFAQQNLPGVYCVPTASDSHEWHGVLFLRQGMYQGAILRFALKFPSDFPETENPPSVIFEIPVFHPDIDPETGELNVRRGFPTWKCGIHHVYQVLIYLQRCFFAIECTEPMMNREAAKLYCEDVEKYCERAHDSVRRSREFVYDPPQSKDANAIKFTPWDQTVHEPIRARILRSMKDPSGQGSPDTNSAQSTLSANSGSTRHTGLGLSFFDDKTFGVMAKEKTWASPVSAVENLDFRDIVTGDQRKANKPTKSSSKSKLT